MRVSDLLAEHGLQLTLETPSSASRLAWDVLRSAPTEHLDPTPFLDPKILVLTSGIGMNFQDESIWDGYVERLVRLPASALAFAVGTAHAELPHGLVQACIRHDLPLLAVPTTVPLLKIHQHVDNMLQAERIALLDVGWTLADECARLASQDAELSTLLATIFATLEVPIAVYDSTNSLIAQYPKNVTWATAPEPVEQPDVLRIPLPSGLSKPFYLAARLHRPQMVIERILSPVTSILALQLNRSLASDVSSQQDMLRFVSRCEAWSEATRSDVASAFQELGLNRREPTICVVADTSGEHVATSWKLRVALHDCFHAVRIAELDDRMVALAQFPRDSFDDAIERLAQVDAHLPLVIGGPSRTIDDLRISLVHALDLVQHTDSPTVAPALGLSAIVAAAAGRGARESAERFLAPLIEHDTQRTSELLPTLRVWLRNDARPSTTCDELFIHRNSLSYRLERIESILGIDLQSLDGKVTCLMALRLVDLEPY